MIKHFTVSSAAVKGYVLCILVIIILGILLSVRPSVWLSIRVSTHDAVFFFALYLENAVMDIHQFLRHIDINKMYLHKRK